MEKWFTWLVLAALVGISVFRPPRGPQIDQDAPPISAPMLSGERFELSHFKGKIVVIDFWASWCPPCRASLPALHNVAERYAQDDSVWIGSVNKERIQPAQIKDFLRRMKVNFPVILDPADEISNRYQVSSIPTLVVIGADGKVKYSQAGLPSTHLTALTEHLVEIIEDAR